MTRRGLGERRSRTRCGVLLLSLAPLLMGGCPPELTNATADAFETATRGILDAALTLAFDQIRTDRVGG